MLQRALAGGKKVLGFHRSYTRNAANRLKELTSAQQFKTLTAATIYQKEPGKSTDREFAS